MPAGKGARLYMLRLYRGMSRKGDEIKEYLDPNDNDRLRELLVARVTAAMGTDRVRLEQGWTLWVLGPNGSPLYARVSVDPAGRTVVKR